jgi:SAM-dependent methyltransferase
LTDFKYAGGELDLFAAVRNWKSYWSKQIRPFVTGDVLEVGAGIGSNTPFLDTCGNGRWVCLEPDARLAAQLATNHEKASRGCAREIISGAIQNLDPDRKFDTIVYIDVLEHIEDDRKELENAASRLRAGGRIIVLSPAHQWLYTPFDAAIGHFRRYNRAMLRGITPRGLRLERLMYIDSAGLLLSGANLLLLRQSMPTKAQLGIWDKYVIPISRVLDRCLFNSVGKSIIGIWQRAQGFSVEKEIPAESDAAKL